VLGKSNRVQGHAFPYLMRCGTAFAYWSLGGVWRTIF
jgi:hypothetical protein